MLESFRAMMATSHDFATIKGELRQALEAFSESAVCVLVDSGIVVTEPAEETYSLSQNLFSTLFLYSYYRCDIPSSRRVLYATVNQCLRGMVTGCDNLLDHEYKVTIDSDLPRTATTFRSVVDIMASDRILFASLIQYAASTDCRQELVLQAANKTLATLARSGVQEAYEEAGVTERISPDDILNNIHHFKTGLLFQSTWAVPELFEVMTPQMESTKQALYDIGIGCQLLDDLVDLYQDVRDCRHNYVASWLAWFEPTSWKLVQAYALDEKATPACLYQQEHAWADVIKQLAKTRLEKGLSALFLERHQIFVGPISSLIAERIGVSF